MNIGQYYSPPAYQRPAPAVAPPPTTAEKGKYPPVVRYASESSITWSDKGTSAAAGAAPPTPKTGSDAELRFLIFTLGFVLFVQTK